MRHLEYDKKLSLTIKAFRELRQIKQSEIAKAIKLTQTTYSKIEFGQIAITPGQLKLISAALGVSFPFLVQFKSRIFLIDIKFFQIVCC
ncbi:MAG: helix-turn-helix domain-containing protein [Bacteroidia bacterium]